MEPLAADDPRQVGEYRLLQQLGAGGMGRVYLGRTTGGRTVAVKVVRRDLAGDPEFRARFRQEVAAARRVGGTWTPPVLDADTEGGHPWVATGYVAGPALTTAVREFGPLPEPAVRTLGVGLAEALAHVHGLGLVHRDVKPSNVLLTLDGPRLIDFGIARALDSTTALTQSGQVFGSPGFMSPEQANGLPAGPAGDVFALGAVLAYAATGTPPFGAGVSAPVLLYRVLHEEPDLSGLTGPLNDLVRDCLAKDPSARPTPARLRERLDQGGAAAARLGHGDWLPAALAAAVGRSAVQLLDLEAEREGEREAGAPAQFGPPVAVPVPLRTALPVPGPLPSVPGHRPYPPRPRRRRGYGALAAVLVGALLLAGGDLLIERFRDDDRQAAASDPGRTPPAEDGTTPTEPPSKRPEPTGDATDPADDGPTPGASPTGGASPTATGPGVIPAKFLGTWVGERKATDGAVTTVTLTIVQSAPSEEKSRIRAETPSTGIWCEGAWTLSEADERQVSYVSRVTGSSAGEECIADRSIYRLIAMQPDGTLRYSMDLLEPDRYMVLRKKA
ncbi:serine/threonine protein kinase [Streptomyces sp. 1114.5]|uniref:serine/threonine-protein kinase n=1 Tax=Streptomyces sp. 1114.5 TaxID=1938830 RepID=UPI000EAD3991|nr:serine/threonine-protein kinase [Streptomyces sp. 1114.5]RKT16954.1 serine/threonine protein kinase [Streptomyces sp. 1114.5]